MHLTLMIAGALVPASAAAELTAALDAPALTQLLARATIADRIPGPPGAADVAWLARALFAATDSAAIAPYAWASLTGAAPVDRVVWFADPVHAAIGRDSLIVQALDDAPPSDMEAAGLLAAANATLADSNCELLRAGRWFLHAEQDWAFSPPPLAQAIGAPWPPPTPEDTGALLWYRLHNAIQMRWHADPVNQSRENRGLPAINALWLHGGGRWKPLPPLRWPRVHSDRAELLGAARAAGAQAVASSARVDGDALLVWDDAAAPSRWQDWPKWLAAMAVLDRRIASLPSSRRLELVLTGHRQVRTVVARPTDRLKIWRKSTLADALTE